MTAWHRSGERTTYPQRTHCGMFTRGHDAALSHPLEQALVLSKVLLFLAFCFCDSDLLDDNFKLPHILPPAFWLLPSTYLSIYWFQNPCFSVFTFHLLSFRLGLVILLSRPLTSMSLVGELSQARLILGTMKLSMEPKLLEELSLQFYTSIMQVKIEVLKLTTFWAISLLWRFVSALEMYTFLI